MPRSLLRGIEPSQINDFMNMKIPFTLLVCALSSASAFAASELLFDNSDFEKGTLGNWTAEGDAMTIQPTKGDQIAARTQGKDTNNVQGEYWVGTFEKYDGKTGSPGAVRGDAATGRLVSKEFTIKKPYITFRIGGGTDNNLLGVGLIVNGEEWMGSANLTMNATMKPMSFDVRKLQGKKVKLLVYDNSTVGWGWINVDDFRSADEPQGNVFIPIKRPKLADEWSTFPLYERVGYDQALRPQFHFTSRMGWINDPNGMVYYDGEWHLCFQLDAKGTASGPKSWGNAVSKDLMHWEQLPHAINPYPNVMSGKGDTLHTIWSGSACVDELNALGKQTGKVKTLFAIYTATYADENHKGAFFQAGAYSTDKGRTWTKINGGKPIIEHIEGYDPGQRDPYVFYHAPTKSYVIIMFVGGPEHAVRLWRSTDLSKWKVLQDIPNKAAECINMFSVALDGDPKNKKWVITNAGTGYEVGDFDGQKWTGLGGKGLQFQYGDSYYAAQAFNSAPDNRTINVGWMPNAQPGYSIFTDNGMPFTQQLSIPTELTLRTTPAGIRLYQYPVKEIEKLYSKTNKWENLSIETTNMKLSTLKPELIDLSLAFAPAGDLTLNVRGLKIEYKAAKQEFSFTNTARIEGMRAAMIKLPADKQRPDPDTGRRVVPAPAVNGQVKLRVLVDRTSLELFVNDGAANASFTVIPAADNRTISIDGNAAQKLDSVVINELKSIWY